MLHTKLFFTALLLVMVNVSTPLFAQGGMAEVKEHFYDNIHLISYPIVEYATRSDEQVEERQYEFEVFPGGDVSEIRFNYALNGEVDLLANGSLKSTRPNGQTFESAPYAYQEGPNGEIVAIPVHFEIKDTEIYLVAGAYEMAQILTIEMKSVSVISTQTDTAAPAKDMNTIDTNLITYVAR